MVGAETPPRTESVEVPKDWSVCTIRSLTVKSMSDKAVRNFLELSYGALVVNDPARGVFHISEPQKDRNGFYSLLQELKTKKPTLEIVFDNPEQARVIRKKREGIATIESINPKSDWDMCTIRGLYSSKLTTKDIEDWFKLGYHAMATSTAPGVFHILDVKKDKAEFIEFLRDLKIKKPALEIVFDGEDQVLERESEIQNPVPSQRGRRAMRRIGNCIKNCWNCVNRNLARA